MTHPHWHAIFRLWRLHWTTSTWLYIESYTRFTTDKWERISCFIISASGSSYMSMLFVCFLQRKHSIATKKPTYMSMLFVCFLQHKDNEPLSIYINIKSQDGFTACMHQTQRNIWHNRCLFTSWLSSKRQFPAQNSLIGITLKTHELVNLYLWTISQK